MCLELWIRSFPCGRNTFCFALMWPFAVDWAYSIKYLSIWVWWDTAVMVSNTDIRAQFPRGKRAAIVRCYPGFFPLCAVILCFRNPPNSDMDCRIFNLIILMCAYTHGGWAHRWVSRTFWLWKTRTFFLCSWRGWNLCSLDLELMLYQLSHPVTPCSYDTFIHLVFCLVAESVIVRHALTRLRVSCRSCSRDHNSRWRLLKILDRSKNSLIQW